MTSVTHADLDFLNTPQHFRCPGAWINFFFFHWDCLQKTKPKQKKCIVFLLPPPHAGFTLALSPVVPSQAPNVVLGWPPRALCLLMMSMIASTLCHPPPCEKQRAKQTAGRNKTTGSPQQMVTICKIKNKNHGRGDKTHNLKGCFLVAYFEIRYLLFNGRGERGVGVQRWRPRVCCSLFNSLLSQALDLQCLRMKTQGRHMKETIIYQILDQNNFKLAFCYSLSIDLSVIGSF